MEPLHSERALGVSWRIEEIAESEVCGGGSERPDQRRVLKDS